MNENDTVSITIKGLDRKAKDSFNLFCTILGKSMNELLKDFINGTYAPTTNQRQFLMVQTVANLMKNDPQLIDSFILQHEPMYGFLSDFHKNAARSTFVYINPTYIFEMYKTWMEEKEQK